MALVLASCASDPVDIETSGVVEVASVTTVLAECPDLPRPNAIDEAAFESLASQAFDILGTESGLQSGGARAEGLMGLEFVDPPREGFDELLAQLPEGFCIDSIRFTPEPPTTLDVIDESGDVSPLPESVGEVLIGFSPEVGQPTRESTEITLWLSELGCASGQPMGERLLGPEVHESEDQILIAAGVAIQLTGQDCPGNPATEVVVALDAPVGDREIRNATTGEQVGISDDFR